MNLLRILAVAAVFIGSPAAAADLQPHRATFTLSLGGGAVPGILGVVGRMIVEYEAACDGTVTRQAMQMLIRDAMGKTTETRYASTLWERSDGREMTFDTNATFGEQSDPAYAGRALLGQGDADPGRVTYDVPAGGTMQLRPGTIFPTEHTLRTMAAAMRGETLLTDEVFEGGAPMNYTQVTAAITPAPAAEPTLAGLAERRAWNVREAHFRPGARVEAPQFEVGFRVYEGGIIDALDLDYGPFRVVGKLATLELLPAPRC